MERFGDRVFVKTGAEGVFCGALPESGLGVAIKVDDGAARASEVAMAGVIERFVPLGDEDRAALGRLLHPALRNWNGIEVGSIAPAS
jgi:L-asparaginase II